MEKNKDYSLHPTDRKRLVSITDPFDRQNETTPMKEDTIAAISTPYGESGIGIVRTSGPLAEAIASSIFRPKKEIPCLISHHVHYGEIVDPQSERPIDEVLLLFMKAPNTYTKEDVVEIQCHGGYLVLKKTLDIVLKQGARLAHPGEFTKRAFMNGRIDLTQAEAVIDLIRAKTTAALEIANQQLRGMFKNKMHSLKEQLLNHLTLMEAQIDFPEEEIEPIAKGMMELEMKNIIKELEGWIDSYQEGRIFREGIACAIIGKTNVGKSSLLNALLRENRAIVTPFPGTTRDIIEEVLNIQGIPVRLVDTAGLRKTVNSIEREGVKRAEEMMKDADLSRFVIDGSREVGQEDLEIVQSIGNKEKVVVLNKIDLPLITTPEALKHFSGVSPIVPISARNQEGINDLKETIYRMLVRGELKVSPEHIIIANIRHTEALSMAKENLLYAVKGLEEGNSYEFVAFELRAVLESLGELVGETAPEEVLNRIFEKFCVGK